MLLDYLVGKILEMSLVAMPIERSIKYPLISAILIDVDNIVGFLVSNARRQLYVLATANIDINHMLNSLKTPLYPSPLITY